MMERDQMFLLHLYDETVYLMELVPKIDEEKLRTDCDLQHMVPKALEIIGEAAKNISPDLKAEYPEVAWVLIAGMRDRLVHGYFDVSWEIVWSVLQTDVPRLFEQTSRILSEKGWK